MKKILLFVAAGFCAIAVFASPPYGFYQILRWIVCLAAVLDAIHSHSQEKQNRVALSIALAILFNPILPIHLSREAWRVIDAISALILATLGATQTTTTK